MRIPVILILVAAGGLAAYTGPGNEFHFVILGDRTGGAVPGVYEEAWRETNRDNPAFVISVGDTIQGGNDLTMDAQWQQVMHVLAPYRRYHLFLTPGNHDVWSVASAQAFEKYSKHPLNYSFDYKQAHFTVLDNSRSDGLSAEGRRYLQKDLQVPGQQPVTFVFSRRPSWILQAVLAEPVFRLRRLAERCGVRDVVAGHLHEMLHFAVD